ncbi:MAG TPA: hypothetical protein DDY77_01600 [Clostridiales bacterium]|nr:hypothetical protein [Clostridiales bacterium]
MNREIGFVASIVNIAAVCFFAISMLFGFNFGNYFSSMFIAFSFVVFVCSYAFFADEKHKVAGFVAVAFAAIYAAIILLVYFAQLTVVRSGELTEQAEILLDFQKMSLMFDYDLLGYALMSLSKFFAGLTIEPKNKPDKWLKALLMMHGVFFISCLIMPMLGIFKADSSPWVGIAVLEFWCVYFCPIAVLSALHFYKKPKNKTTDEK